MIRAMRRPALSHVFDDLHDKTPHRCGLPHRLTIQTMKVLAFICLAISGCAHPLTTLPLDPMALIRATDYSYR